GISRPAAGTGWRHTPPRRRCGLSTPRPAGTGAEAHSPPPVAAVARRPEYVGRAIAEARLRRHSPRLAIWSAAMATELLRSSSWRHGSHRERGRRTATAT